MPNLNRFINKFKLLGFPVFHRTILVRDHNKKFSWGIGVFNSNFTRKYYTDDDILSDEFYIIKIIAGDYNDYFVDSESLDLLQDEIYSNSDQIIQITILTYSLMVLN